MRYSILAALIALSFFFAGIMLSKADAAPVQAGKKVATQATKATGKQAQKSAEATSVELASFKTSNGRTAMVTTFSDGSILVTVDNAKYTGAAATSFLARNGIHLQVQNTGHIIVSNLSSGAKLISTPAPAPAAVKSEMTANAKETPSQAVEVAKFKTSEEKSVTVTTYDDSTVVVTTETDQMSGAPALRYLSQGGVAVQTTPTGHISATDVTNGAKVIVAPLAVPAGNADAQVVEVAKFMTGDKKTVTVTTYSDNSVVVNTEGDGQITGSEAKNFLTSNGIALQVQGAGHIAETEVTNGSKILTDPISVSKPSVDTSNLAGDTSASSSAGISATAAQAAEVVKFMTDDKQVADVTTGVDGSVTLQVGNQTLTGSDAIAFLKGHSIDMGVDANGHITNTDVTNSAKVLVPPLAAALAANSADKADGSQNKTSEQKKEQQAKQGEQASTQQSSESKSSTQSQSWAPSITLPANIAVGSSAQVQQSKAENPTSSSSDNNINEPSISK